ncbi:MAG: Holliday junction resolvase RuvX, partial [Armatimonadota bacterium]|nr:Holliday junction resolvase RuvX [Armatimonadota bacterium]
LALDIGERRIGVAVSDAFGVLAQPLAVLSRQSVAKDVAQLAQLIREQEAQTVVVGLPVTLRGEQTQAAQQVQAFVARLREAVTVPVVFVDERLSTAEAERRLLEADLRRAERRQKVDAVAAALILERYLRQRESGTDGLAERTP